MMRRVVRRMTSRGSIGVAVAVMLGLLLGAPSVVSADLLPYSQDFEAMDQADPAALADDGWLVFGNVFGPDWAYWYGYGPFPAPNGSPGFSAVTAGEGGPEQGAQQLVAYSDYNNGDHAVGAWIEANVYQEWTIGAADVGSTWTFDFDVKRGDLEPDTTAKAFIKTLDPDAGWALTNFLFVETHALPTTWGSDSISLPIDESLEGQILQIGFLSTATYYTPSGMIYDNINFTPEPASLALIGVGALVLLRRRR